MFLSSLIRKWVPKLYVSGHKQQLLGVESGKIIPHVRHGCWTSPDLNDTAHQRCSLDKRLIFSTITCYYGKWVTVLVIAIAVGDSVKYQSLIYVSFVLFDLILFLESKRLGRDQTRIPWICSQTGPNCPLSNLVQIHVVQSQICQRFKLSTISFKGEVLRFSLCFVFLFMCWILCLYLEFSSFSIMFSDKMSLITIFFQLVPFGDKILTHFPRINYFPLLLECPMTSQRQLILGLWMWKRVGCQ